MSSPEFSNSISTRDSIYLVQGQDGEAATYTPTEICALKGSTVEMQCSYTYPYSEKEAVTRVEQALWFTKEEDKEPVDLRSDSEYEGRVEYQGNDQYYSSYKPYSRLRISDLRESDSAVYKFRFITNQPGGEYTGEPGVSLIVTDLKVEVIKLTGGQVELKCRSICRSADCSSYVWYKNGKKIEEGTSSSYRGNFNPDDSYSCALKGCEDFHSPSVYAPKVPSVSVSPSGEIVEGSSVTLTCSSDANPAATYTWYKKNGNPDQEAFRTGPQLDFVSIQSSDSGEFYCTAQNELGEKTSDSTSIDVKYAPKVPSVSVRPSGEIVEGSSVTLTCSSDANPAATYTWYKSSDSGEFYCTVQNELGEKTSDSTSIDVKYDLKVPSVSVSPSGEIVEGSSVTLTCSSDANPAANYTWYKKNGNPDQEPFRTGPQLHFVSIQSSDSGEFYCTAQNELGEKTSDSTSIDVKYAPKVPSVSVSPSGEIVEGSSVTLTCSSDANPAATYTWYKKNGNPDQEPFRTGPQLDFVSIQSSDSGEFYCTAQNELGGNTSDSTFIDSDSDPVYQSVTAAQTEATEEQEDQV
ncbi:B-cell receptor CD22-like [Myripristis murdjan]|uniref:B-cell receptor CD22-like n=1 Tax=Myripristis murdjan TaxID=586833 RepID=UPI00117641D3|nr:B-cell receptor CD22-like [Myripristis murdjan]